MSVAEQNRKYFDHVTDIYDSKPWFAVVNKQVTDGLRERLDWIGIPFVNTDSGSNVDSVRFLDYACGPGLLSRVFGPYVTVTRGLDISPNMVATYNARARVEERSASTMNAVVGNLFDKEKPPPEELSGPEWNNFDLVAAGFAFHHFEDVVYAAKCLKERLRPGGALVITDFVEGGDLKADEEGNPIPGTEGNHALHHHHGHDHEHGHNHHDHAHVHEHHTANEKQDDPSITFRKEMEASIVTPHFTLNHVKSVFTEAGLVDVDVVSMEKRVYMEFGGNRLWRTVMLAKGRRPLEDKSEL